MEAVIQIALMFFFVQFLVVSTLMTVALLLARPEVPVLGRKQGSGTVRRSFIYVTHLPSGICCSAVRLMRRLPFLHGTADAAELPPPGSESRG